MFQVKVLLTGNLERERKPLASRMRAKKKDLESLQRRNWIANFWKNRQRYHQRVQGEKTALKMFWLIVSNPFKKW